MVAEGFAGCVKRARVGKGGRTKTGVGGEVSLLVYESKAGLSRCHEGFVYIHRTAPLPLPPSD